MKSLAGWIVGYIVLFGLLWRFTRMSFGTALGVTILLISIPILVHLSSIGSTFAGGDVGSIGAVIFLLFLGGGLLLLGVITLIICGLFNVGKKLSSNPDDAGRNNPVPEKNREP